MQGTVIVYRLAISGEAEDGLFIAEVQTAPHSVSMATGVQEYTRSSTIFINPVKYSTRI